MLHPHALDPSRAGKQAEALHQRLSTLIVGQNEAIEQIVSVYQMYLSGLTAVRRPVANFLFLGPTGSGKTRTVEATAEALLQKPGAVIKIDCGEFQHSHEIAKLVGSPPGYLGHKETRPLLCQEVIDEHHTEAVKISLILFDEIEKASDSLWNLLLGILDKATLTLGDNRKVDFSRAMIFMTSNVGATEMTALTSPKLGFHATSKASNTGVDENLSTKMARCGTQAARRKFTPEFINRIDKIAVFRPLGRPELQRIFDLEIRQVQQRILEAPGGRPFLLRATDAAKSFLLSQGTNVNYGARHLKRTIELLVVHPVSNLIASDQISAGDMVEVYFDDQERTLKFARIDQGLSLQTMTNVLASGLLPQAAARAA